MLRRNVFIAGGGLTAVGMVWKAWLFLSALLSSPLSGKSVILSYTLVVLGVAMMGFTSHKRGFRAVMLGMALPLSGITACIAGVNAGLLPGNL